MSKPIILLDNGHGVDTSGKRSPKWADGSQLKEWEFNRDIVKRVARALSAKSISHKILVPEEEDISLKTRCKRANKHKSAILISIHANAGGGSGIECFTSVGDTYADRLATIFLQTAHNAMPNVKMRYSLSDGDIDKECNFYILKHTRCPAILTENFFMDNETDCKFLLTDEGRDKIAGYHVDAILEMLNLYK